MDVVDVGGCVGGEPPQAIIRVSHPLLGTVMLDAGGHGQDVGQLLLRNVHLPTLLAPYLQLLVKHGSIVVLQHSQGNGLGVVVGWPTL